MEDAMHMKKNVDLTEGTIWKQLLLFCLPIMFGTLFQQLYNAVDVVVVGQLGDSRRPLYYLIVCCFINIFLDVILVAFFRLGVTGVAIATVTAQAGSALLTLRALCRLDLGGDHPLLPGFLGSDCCCDDDLLFL